MFCMKYIVAAASLKFYVIFFVDFDSDLKKNIPHFCKSSPVSEWASYCLQLYHQQPV